MRKAFTLIEMLVVISIIALLISIMLPSLVGARDQARIVACLSQARGMAQGVLTYTTDNKTLYPATPYGRTQPHHVAVSSRDDQGDQQPFNFDLRPIFRDYFGHEDLNTVMNCPMGSQKWRAKATNNYNIDRIHSGYSQTPYSFYFGQPIPAGHPDVPSSYSDVRWGRTKGMVRAGDRWIPKQIDLEFNLLVSDVVYKNNWNGDYLVTTHRPVSQAAREGGSGTGTVAGHQIFNLNTDVTGNFVCDDGGGKTLKFNYNSTSDGTFTSIRNHHLQSQSHIVPLEFGF